MELDILIITNALATSLSLLVAVVMMLNKNNIFHKIIPYVILALALYNLIDLLNLSVNHAYFYSLFNIRYSQFQNYILAFNSNTSGGQTNVIWMNGGITVEEDWNTQIAS